MNAEAGIPGLALGLKGVDRDARVDCAYDNVGAVAGFQLLADRTKVQRERRLRDFDAAGESSTAPNYIGVALLTSAAELIGDSCFLLPDPGRTDRAEPVVLWEASVGPPSSGKTPPLIPFERELDRLKKETRRGPAIELAEYKAGCDIVEQAKKAWLGHIRKAVKKGEEPPEKPSNAEPPDPVKVPRVVVRDATIEEMASRLWWIGSSITTRSSWTAPSPRSRAASNPTRCRNWSVPALMMACLPA